MHCYNLPWRGTVVLAWSHGWSWLDFLNYGDQRCSAVARQRHAVASRIIWHTTKWWQLTISISFGSILGVMTSWVRVVEFLWGTAVDDVVSLALFIVCCLSTVKLLDESDTKTGSFEWVQKHLNLWTLQVDTIQNALLNKSIPIDVEILRNMDISFTIDNFLWINSLALRFAKIMPNSLRFAKIRPNSTIKFNLNFIHLFFSLLLFSSLIMPPTGFGFEFTNTTSWQQPECVTH